MGPAHCGLRLGLGFIIILASLAGNLIIVIMKSRPYAGSHIYLDNNKKPNAGAFKKSWQQDETFSILVFLYFFPWF